jgi:hypothetical protein
MLRKFWSKTLKGGNYFEDLVMNGSIILEWILGKYIAKVWT